MGLQLALPDDEETARCAACRLIRRQPDADDTMAWEKLATAAVDLRRLLVQLPELGLPMVGWHEREGGLGFDLFSSRTANTPVMIGHANGIITIDLVESLDDYREAMRVRLGEPYRTMLGHFRHEVGHYYQWILVESAGDPTCSSTAGASSATSVRRTPTRSTVTTGPGRPRAGSRPSSPSTRPCTRGRTSRSASRTTCTSRAP